MTWNAQQNHNESKWLKRLDRKPLFFGGFFLCSDYLYDQNTKHLIMVSAPVMAVISGKKKKK